MLKACVSVDVSLPAGSHRSHSKAPLYVLTQFAGAVLWMLFAALTYIAYDVDSVSMCVVTVDWLLEFYVLVTSKVIPDE